MRLRLENLGSIPRATLDLAPLTVFIGHNNTNKTWAAYSFYGLACLCSASRNPFVVRQPRTPDYTSSVQLPERLLKNIESVADRDATFILNQSAAQPATTPPPGTPPVQQPPRVSLTMKREELLAGVQGVKLTLDAAAIANILALSQDSVAGATASLEIGPTDSNFSPLALQMSAERAAEFVQVATNYIYPTLPSFLQGGARFAHTDFDKGLRAIVAAEARKLALAYLGNVVAFPAERIALTAMHGVLFPPPPALSMPLTDYIWQTYHASRGPVKFASILQSMPVDDIIALLQGKLLGGKMQFTGQQMPKALEYVMPSAKPLRIHGASSLVKSLAGLALYLESPADFNDVLVIDEPEMNAHPQAQLAIAELLTILVNRGLRIIITTHSPYIVEQINNLVAGARLPTDKKSAFASKLELGTEEAFIERNKVAVYWFEKGNEPVATYNKDTDLFDIDTFSNMSDRLNSLYADIQIARKSK